MWSLSRLWLPTRGALTRVRYFSVAPSAPSSAAAGATSSTAASSSAASAPISLFPLTAAESRNILATPLVPTLVGLQSVRARYRDKQAPDDQDDDYDRRDLKTRTLRIGEFLIFPGLLITFFYIGVAMEPLLSEVDQWCAVAMRMSR